MPKIMKSDSEKNLTILGHLSELRKRILRCVIAVAVASILAFIFAPYIFNALTLPANGIDINLVYIDLTEMLGTYMKVSLATGIALAMPYLIYQILVFIFPALNSQEKRYVFLLLPLIALMFAGGVFFSYFILMPPAIKFLLTFGNDIASPQIRIGSYITVVTRVLLAMGIVFELPVISAFLARVGIISSAWLASKRKFGIILAFVLAAVITPTFDPLNQSLVAVPLIILFEMSIWLARLVQRKPLTSKAILA